MKKIGRNDPCPCGSGKKYKKCCLGKEEEKSFREQNPASKSGAKIRHDEGSFEDERILKEYQKLKKTEERIDFVKNLFPLEEDFATEYMIEIFSPLHDELGSAGRHAEAVELFHLFSKENRGIYKDAYSAFDEMLVYHHIFLNDLEGIRMILERFHSAPDQNIDNYMDVLTALECHGHYRIAMGSYQQTRKKIISSQGIIGWGKDEFIEKIAALTILDYLFEEEKTIRNPDDLFKTLQEYSQTDGAETGHYQRILTILEGKEKSKWTVQDFVSGETGFRNLVYLSMEFVRWLKERYGLKVLGLGENYREETVAFLHGLGKKSLLAFSNKKMDGYLARHLRFPVFKQGKALLALEGTKEFFAFLHQQGLTDADTLKEVNHSYDVFKKQIERILGESLWKYSWREMLKLNDPRTFPTPLLAG